MNEQPEALRLADRLDQWGDQGDLLEAAAELRRLHAEVERLKSAPMKYRRMAFNAELQVEVEALRADAERYRWFRENWAELDIDAAIDAARSEK